MRVNAAYVSVSSHVLPTWIAYELGYFKQQGLDVHMSFVQGSVTAVPAMSTGELSMVDGTPAAAVQAQIKGVDTIALATHIPYADYRLMAVPSIHNVSDLRGKAVGATKAGTVDDVVIQYVLKKLGLTPGKDVKMTYLGTQSAELAALKQGIIAASPLSPPNNLTAQKAGAHQILNVLDDHFPYPVDGVISTRSFVKQHPKRTVAYLRAYLQGLHFIKAHPAQTKRILAKYTKQSDTKILDAGYQDLIGDLADPPLPTIAQIKTVLPLFPGGAGKDPASFIDAAPLQQALKELGK